MFLDFFSSYFLDFFFNFFLRFFWIKEFFFKEIWIFLGFYGFLIISYTVIKVAAKSYQG